MSLPPPQTFAEGQRALYGWLVAAAGMFSGALAAALLAVLVWGGWPITTYPQIITILGTALGGFIVGMIAVIVVLAIGGPVSKMRLSFGGSDIETEGD